MCPRCNGNGFYYKNYEILKELYEKHLLSTDTFWNKAMNDAGMFDKIDCPICEGRKVVKIK